MDQSENEYRHPRLLPCELPAYSRGYVLCSWGGREGGREGGRGGGRERERGREQREKSQCGREIRIDTRLIRMDTCVTGGVGVLHAVSACLSLSSCFSVSVSPPTPPLLLPPFTPFTGPAGVPEPLSSSTLHSPSDKSPTRLSSDNPTKFSSDSFNSQEIGSLRKRFAGIGIAPS